MRVAQTDGPVVDAPDDVARGIVDNQVRCTGITVDQAIVGENDGPTDRLDFVELRTQIHRAFDSILLHERRRLYDAARQPKFGTIEENGNGSVGERITGPGSKIVNARQRPSPASKQLALPMRILFERGLQGHPRDLFGQKRGDIRREFHFANNVREQQRKTLGTQSPQERTLGALGIRQSCFRHELEVKIVRCSGKTIHESSFAQVLFLDRIIRQSIAKVFREKLRGEQLFFPNAPK